MDAAAHQDTILAVSGTYNEHVTVHPANGDTNQFYISFMPDDLTADPPQTQWSQGGQNENLAAFEIHNDPTDGSGRYCHDMRLTLKAFEIIGGNRVAALSVWNGVTDADREYTTGILIKDNYLESEKNVGGAAVIGMRSAQSSGLVNQSIKWGHFLNSEVVSTTQGDAVTCWHFVGTARNNRVQSNLEGWHLGYGRLDDPYPAFLDSLEPPLETPSESLFEHNLFYCNASLGLHFVHGSKGIVQNNIFSRNQADGPTVSHALYLGEPPTPTDPLCVADSTECITVVVNGDTILIDVVAHNNVIDIADGNGLRVHEYCIATLYANTITRSGNQSGSQAAFEIVGANYQGANPWFSSDYELL